MYLKIIGAVGIVASSYAIGWYLSLGETYRAADLSDMKNILSRFLSEISFGNAILTEAVENVVDDTSCAKIFVYFKEELEKRGTDGIADMWEKAVKRAAPLLYLNAADLDEILSLGKIFSYSDIGIQQKVLGRAIEYMNNEQEVSRTKKQSGGKIYKTLGAAVGLFIVILLY
jgi:stage III sporulation protein AB